MQEGKHFPVVGVSYGMLSMLKSQLFSPDTFVPLAHELIHENLQQNLCQNPNETFMFDGLDGLTLEQLFDST